MKTSTLEKVLAGNANMTPLRGEMLGNSYTGHVVGPFSSGAMFGGLAATFVAFVYGDKILGYIKQQALNIGGSI